MTFGTGSIVTSATSFSRTYSPLGVSNSRFSMSLKVSRVSGVLQTWTSYALPSRKMSPASSPASNRPAALRTSPGLSP